MLKRLWVLVLEYLEDQHSCRVGECVTQWRVQWVQIGELKVVASWKFQEHLSNTQEFYSVYLKIITCTFLVNINYIWVVDMHHEHYTQHWCIPRILPPPPAMLNWTQLEFKGLKQCFFQYCQVPALNRNSL